MLEQEVMMEIRQEDFDSSTDFNESRKMNLF